MRFCSPMATGNGAYIVHKILESRITGYKVSGYNPYWTLFPPFLRFVRCRGAELIHTTQDYAPFFHRDGIPMVLTVHGYNLDREIRKYNSFLQNLHYDTDLRWFSLRGLRQASAVTCVSNFIAGLVRQDAGYMNELRVIYNGVDEKQFSPVQKPGFRNKIRVLFSGNPTRKKGIELLPGIIRLLNKNIEVLVTSGLRAKKIPFEHAQLVNVGSVPHADMPSLYRNCDILLFPSVREGLSMAALEAMSSGLPIVAANNSSFPELIDHGKGGFLCQQDSPEEYADYINHLAESMQLRNVMGQYNRARVESGFTLERMIRQYHDLFDEVISKR